MPKRILSGKVVKKSGNKTISVLVTRQTTHPIYIKIIRNEKIKSFVSDFNDHLNILKRFSEWMIDKAKTEKDDVSAAANDYLKTLGYVSIAYAWIKVLEVSFKDFNENKNFYEDKIDTARFYFDKVLPRAEQHYKSAISGSSNIMSFKFS